MELTFGEQALAAAKTVLGGDTEITTHSLLAQRKATLEQLTAYRSLLLIDIENETSIVSGAGSSSDEVDLMQRRLKSDTEDMHVIDEAIGKLEPAIEEAESRLSTKFNKYRSFGNIRELLKTSDVKLGQIEREAGLQPGYMSRLEKPENSTEPTVEFLFTAARLLKVPIDYLISGSVTAITSTEQYMLEFLDKLIRETQDGTLPWQRETTRELRGVYVMDVNSNETSHPLYNVIYNGEFEDYFSEYSSRFYKDEPVRPTATCYNVTINESRHRVYIMSCSLDGSDYGGELIPDFYEVYLVDIKGNKQVIPLFCTTRSCEAVVDRLDTLIGAIKLAESHVQIDQRARYIIDQYLLELPF